MLIYNFLTRGAKTKDHAKYLYKLKIRNISVRLLQITILISIFIIWEVLGRVGWINTFLMSQPSKILSLFIKMLENGEMIHHIRITLTEDLIGFTAGSIIGIITAILLWWSDYFFDLLEPYIVILNSVPKVALGPVIIVWMGNGPQAIILMTLLISIIVTIMMLINGFHEVEKNKIKLLQTMGASKKQILFKVILPASIPTIFSALKVSVGSLVGTIVGEF